MDERKTNSGVVRKVLKGGRLLLWHVLLKAATCEKDLWEDEEPSCKASRVLEVGENIDFSDSESCASLDNVQFHSPVFKGFIFQILYKGIIYAL